MTAYRAVSLGRRAGSFRALTPGFTLIEVMIVVAIVAILAAIALPAYSDYVTRGKLVDGTNALASLRARMEQYYQDNRTYADSGSFSPPCKSAGTAGTFTISCDVDASTYTVTATGSGTTEGFTYTIDQDGGMATTALPTGWGDTSSTCWVIRKGGACS